MMKTLNIWKLAQWLFLGLMVLFNISNFCSGQTRETVPIEPVLRFGMEIKQHSLGIEIADIRPDRPVSKKLRKGDIFRSYELASKPGESFPVATEQDIDDIKSALGNGETVIVTLLRPSEEDGLQAFLSLLVTLEASDLIGSQRVNYASEEMSYTYTSTTDETNETAPPHEVLVSVFYATDRSLENGIYTGSPDESADPLKYGACVVSIPPVHVIGQLEGPTFWQLDFRPDPTKHIVLRTVAQIGKTATFDAIASHFEALTSVPRKRVLVFFHGYNVAFDEAARRAAQMHYDLKFPGVTMFYSWPSDALLRSYVADASDVDWSVTNMKAFLTDLEKQQIDDIYLLGHSMGNRGLTKALVELRRERGGSKIKELILAAADVDARVFTRDIAPILSSSIPNTTIYASSSDLALWSSYTLSSTPRVGEIRNGEPTVSSSDEMNVIDVSSIRSDFIGHSAYGTPTVITDIRNLIHEATFPRPFLKAVSGSKGPYWEFISAGDGP